MTHPPELRQRAHELRKQGVLIRVIAADLDVPKETVARWLNPTLERRERTRAKKRKFLQHKRCPKCRRKMSDNAKHCKRCSLDLQRYWTRERIIEAIQAWALAHGHAPTSDEWERGGKGHPAISSIIGGPRPVFTKWSEALLAAGFEPRKRRGSRHLTREQRGELRRKKGEGAVKKALAKQAKGG